MGIVLGALEAFVRRLNDEIQTLMTCCCCYGPVEQAEGLRIVNGQRKMANMRTGRALRLRSLTFVMCDFLPDDVRLISWYSPT